MSKYTVIIRKGVAYVRWWDSKQRKDVEELKSEQILSDRLQSKIELEDTTFGQFFEFIRREADLFEKIFSSSMYGHPIKPYLDEIQKPSTKPADMDFVRVYWVAECDADEFTVTTGFDGWGDWHVMEEGTPVPKGGIAIEFTGLNEYKDLPLKLETELELWDTRMAVPKEPMIKSKKVFTVYDVLDAILFEITWSGDISKGRSCPFDMTDEEAMKPVTE